MGANAKAGGPWEWYVPRYESRSRKEGPRQGELTGISRSDFL